MLRNTYYVYGPQDTMVPATLNFGDFILSRMWGNREKVALSVEVQGQTDTLFIMYSSGTTGLPKGVMTTHANVITVSCFSSDVSRDETLLLIAPWNHAMGLVGALSGFSIGLTAVFLPNFDVDTYLKIVEKFRVPPAEIEAVLLQHEGIRDAAVIGIEDKAAGEVPLAFVVTQPEKTLTEKEVKEFVAERINGITENRLTYGDIVQQATNFAISLARMGIKKGDTIGLMSENREEFWGAVVGVACTGAILTPISIGYVKGEIIHVTNISKPKYIICSPMLYKLHAKTLNSLKSVKKIILFGEENQKGVLMYNDMALEKNGFIKNVKYEDFQSVEVQGQTDTLFIMYSSGTTGLPKGVMTTHANVITVSCFKSNVNTDEISLMIAPWYHAMGLVGALNAFATGLTSVFLAKFDVDTYLKIVEKFRIAQLTVVPPMLVALCKNESKYDLSSVRKIYAGAAPLHKDTIEIVREKFPNLIGVFQAYGATEMTLVVLRFDSDNPNTNIKSGSVGMVVHNTTVKIVDPETGKVLGPNQRGEICTKGELLMKGYVGKDKALHLDDEGFYRTGDIGYYDEDRYFYIVDRLKELIKYKGYQVPPAEIEAVLLQHESIRDAAVIGIEDKAAGEVPLAFVVTQPGKTLTEKEVKEFVAERLSNPKHLRGGVRFVEQIPKSPSGKILRRELKEIVKSKAKSKL